MKKWIPIFAAAFLITWIPGCRSNGEMKEQKPMEAMFIQQGDDFKIFVDLISGSPFTANIPEGTDELTTGDVVEIYGDGIMLESYPGQYPGVTEIVVKKHGKESDAEKYQSLLDVLYHEPDPSEPPYLNLEYHTGEANVSAVANQGAVTWSYEDEEGKKQNYTTDMAFILDWKDLNDLRLAEPTDIYLHFSMEAKSVEVIRYERMNLGSDTKGEPKGEKIEVSKEKPKDTEEDKGQYILKDLDKEGVYLVKAEFEQGTVEYGFEVQKAGEA